MLSISPAKINIAVFYYSVIHFIGLILLSLHLSSICWRWSFWNWSTVYCHS